MTDRAQDLQIFVTNSGWGTADQAHLAGDASNRRYLRLRQQNGACAVLMDAPPAKGEDIRPFVHIAQHLTSVGLSAPRILAEDPEQGFLLLEDLGDDLFTRLIERDPGLEPTLYETAIDVLHRLHSAPPPSLKPYDAPVMAPLAALAFDWYQFGATGHVDTAARDRFSAAFAAILAPLDAGPKVLIQRDYHAENLLWLPQRTGPARVGLLDFQDAMLGHPAYDLVSVLQDARRDVPPALEAAMTRRFLDGSPADPDQFMQAYSVLGAQRNLRILGVFARLCLRDGKAQYVDLIPRVWDHLQTNLAHPALSDISQDLHNQLPPPTPQILDHLKANCATCPDR
ncbi:phosphotransferase [uncultured Roseobacter sp.]|uniref:aminoglycoside phosphotransferase family protein n=1 Tax=uncultured Roseobacter sp. TaxID=114847 RepID=UPI00262D2094|nr:phosphotransferase [uncultured Roseobacter sp.]